MSAYSVFKKTLNLRRKLDLIRERLSFEKDKGYEAHNTKIYYYYLILDLAESRDWQKKMKITFYRSIIILYLQNHSI